MLWEFVVVGRIEVGFVRYCLEFVDSQFSFRLLG